MPCQQVCGVNLCLFPLIEFLRGTNHCRVVNCQSSRKMSAMITWHIDSHSHHGDQVNRWSRHLERYFQSSYLSKYHKSYLWRKNCHAEKFWGILRNFGRFCHNSRAFMLRKIEPIKFICGEEMTNIRSGYFESNV